jgi:predicted ATP-grasp superfamily ATP-dependent carboligase
MGDIVRAPFPEATAEVLIPNGQTRIGLNVARSLGRAGLRVVLGSPTPATAAFASRYVCGYFIHPLAGAEPEAFVSTVSREVGRWRPNLVIPADDASLAALAQTRDRFAGRTTIACPSFAAVRQVLDKEATLALAARLQIPVPATRCLDDSGRDLPLNGLRFPVILKPRLKRLEGELNPIKVLYCRDRDEVQRGLAANEGIKQWVIQEYVPGFGVGIAALARHGEPLALFQYRRLRDLPPGGLSVLRVSEPLDGRLADDAARMLGALGWDGVAMVEFRTDGHHRPVLMEVNGRFWGGLALALTAGMDFPLWLYRYLVDGQAPPDRGYRPGVRCRWLVGEMRRLEYLLRGTPGNDPMDRPSRLRAAGEFLGGFLRTRHYDEFLFGDVRPGLRELWRCTGGRAAAALRRAVPPRVSGRPEMVSPSSHPSTGRIATPGRHQREA